jgi:hypothetical protein
VVHDLVPRDPMLGYSLIFLAAVLAGVVTWLTRADRRKWQAAETARAEPLGSGEAPLKAQPGAVQRITAARVALAAILVGSTAFLIYAWRAQHPSGLMSIDDSTFSMLAILDWRAFTQHGLGGLFTAMTTNGANAPLVPLLASPLTAGNAMTSATVLVQIPFMWLLVISSNSIYRRVTGPQAALIGTVATAFLPGVLMYSRLLHFAVPLTAVLTAALAALLASRSLTSWRWTLAFGALMGLALLTRTIAVALVPGLVVAAVVLAVRRSPLRVWVPNLALGVAAAAVVAGPWYLANFSAVWGYLTANGYDATSPFYVQTPPWMMRLAQIVGQDVFIPLFAVGIVVVGVSLVRFLFRRGTMTTAPLATIAALAGTAGCYFIALASSHNGGTAFTLPLAPLLVALVLYVANHLGRRQAATAGAVAMVVVAVNVWAAVVPLGHSGVGNVVGVGDFAIIDGRSASDAQIQSALGNGNAAVSDPSGLGLKLQQSNCAIAARANEGPILLTRSDALLGGIFYCAEGVYWTTATMYGSGCPSYDGACVAGVINKYGFPTVITGDALAPYPGSNPESLVLPALGDYRMVMEIDIAPGVVVHVWARLGH